MIIITATSVRFQLGQIVATSNAVATLTAADIAEGLQRHARGDWGNVCPSDAELNNEALKQGDRLLSSYGEGSNRFWIITESDRSVTTVLLPEDY
jgi:hypothetical protein